MPQKTFVKKRKKSAQNDKKFLDRVLKKVAVCDIIH